MIIKLQPSITAPDGDSVRHFQSGIGIYNGTTFLGKGNLYISEQTLTWINPEDESGIHFSYYDISFHAISSDQTNFDHSCIYMMVQVAEYMESSKKETNNSQDEEEFEPDDFEEIRLVPENPQSLQLLYNIICECQILNPDE